MQSILSNGSALLAPLRERLRPLSEPVYAPVTKLSELIDEDMDQLIYLAAILMSFLACLILGQISGSIGARKAFSSLAGLTIGFYFYGLLFFLNLGYVLVNYVLMRCCGSREVAGTLITVFSAISLFCASYYHFQVNQATGGWDIDLIFMMNFIKLHMMAVNYVNAGKLDDPVSSKDFTPRERYMAEPLRKRVPFADFMHYFLFCGAAWTGMSHEYRLFYDFINMKGDYTNIPKGGLIAPALKRFG